MIMPLVVLAVGMFFVFSDWRLLGSVGGLVLAHTVLAYLWCTYQCRQACRDQTNPSSSLRPASAEDASTHCGE